MEKEREEEENVAAFNVAATFSSSATSSEKHLAESLRTGCFVTVWPLEHKNG